MCLKSIQMPTSSKRVQVLLKPDLLETVEQIAKEQGLSLGKVVALLTEEAAIKRGLYKPGPKLDGWTTEVVSKKAPPSPGDGYRHQDSEAPDSTMQLLKKIKALQDAGLL